MAQRSGYSADPAAEFLDAVDAIRADPALAARYVAELREERERLLAAKRRWHRAVAAWYERTQGASE